MKVQNSEFFVAELNGEMHIFDREDDAIDHLQEHAGDIDPENDDVAVNRVTIEGDDWTIAQMPWQEIALRLLQEG